MERKKPASNKKAKSGAATGKASGKTAKKGAKKRAKQTGAKRGKTGKPGGAARKAPPRSDASVETPHMRWVNRHPWLDGCDILVERQQAEEEGRDIRRLKGRFKRLLDVPRPVANRRLTLGGARDEAWHAAAGELMDAVQQTPLRPDHPFHEPSDRDEIRAARPDPLKHKAWRGSQQAYLARVHGGLLGRICGCLLGKPVEGWDRRSMRINAEAVGNWPLRGYWRQPNAAQQREIDARQPRRRLMPGLAPMLTGSIDGMVEDDDINYTVIGHSIVRKHGAEFTPQDVASFWLDHVPLLHTYTAERIAYRNLASGVVPPHSATRRNPSREWIGAQIRADFFGYANPGDPERAAAWAWRDACISHVRNGIYGEMWVAAMLAAAFVETDWTAVVRAGLAQIPRRSRLAGSVGRIVELHGVGHEYGAAVEAIHEEWDETNRHHWCHAVSNAPIVAAALLYGEDDYATTIARAVMPGFDTDCNGATAGSLWGVMHGVSALPAEWTAPLDDRVRTGVAGFHDAKISEIAAEMARTALEAK